MSYIFKCHMTPTIRLCLSEAYILLSVNADPFIKYLKMLILTHDSDFQKIGNDFFDSLVLIEKF